jgi:hypothetical protein
MKLILQLLQNVEIQEQHLKYRTTLVRSGVTQLADLLPRYINRFKPVREVTRDNSVTGPGVGALLSQLIWVICGEGDGVLMTTVSPFPAYNISTDYYSPIIVSQH